MFVVILSNCNSLKAHVTAVVCLSRLIFFRQNIRKKAPRESRMHNIRALDGHAARQPSGVIQAALRGGREASRGSQAASRRDCIIPHAG